MDKELEKHVPIRLGWLKVIALIILGIFLFPALVGIIKGVDNQGAIIAMDLKTRLFAFAGAICTIIYMIYFFIEYFFRNVIAFDLLHVRRDGQANLNLFEKRGRHTFNEAGYIIGIGNDYTTREVALLPLGGWFRPLVGKFGGSKEFYEFFINSEIRLNRAKGMIEVTDEYGSTSFKELGEAVRCYSKIFSHEFKDTYAYQGHHGIERWAYSVVSDIWTKDSKIDQLKVQVTEFAGLIKDWHDRVDELERQLEEVNLENSELKLKRVELTHQVDALTTLEKLSHKSLVDLTDQVESSKSAYQELKQIHNELDKENDQANESLSKASEVIYQAILKATASTSVRYSRSKEGMAIRKMLTKFLISSLAENDHRRKALMDFAPISKV